MITTNLWHLDHQHDMLIELGRLTIRWAEADRLMVGILDATLENRAAAQNIVFAGSNAGQQRFNAFVETIGTSGLPQEERQSIIKHIGRLKSLYGARNALTHEPIFTDIRFDNGKLKFGARSLTRDGSSRPMDVAKIKAHIRKVDAILSDLEDIHDQMVADRHDPDDEPVSR
ncbi:hypothetical protein WMC41_15855 [Shinella yambaruensis]|uniref:hypothetical protein n=1 Tax=Shinella yambaruensis TaxID=415996 RepID=UPI003D7AD033